MIGKVASGRKGDNPRSVTFVPYWPANPYQTLLADGLRGLGFDVDTSTSLKSFYRSFRAFRHAGSSLMHLHWLPVASADPRRLARWCLFARRVNRLARGSVPIVWTAHNIVPHESALAPLDLWLSRRVAKHARRVICHSLSARDELVSRLRLVNDAKIRVIPHGHYIDAYPNELSREVCRAILGLPPDAMVFLALGLIRRYKGVPDLIDAFRRIEHPGARLLIAGKAADDSLEADVSVGAKSDPRICYSPGHVADHDLQLYFNAADAVVLPYQKSLTSGALVLAMSFGRACVAPRLPSMVDGIGEHGGILYEPERTDGLLAALSLAITRRSELQAMGSRNLDIARRWEWRSIARATVECYGEAMEAGAAS